MPGKTPLPYQLEKLAAMDAANERELQWIRDQATAHKAAGVKPSREKAREISLRVRRLEKSVKAAARYCQEIGFVRPPRATHENGDGV